MKAYKGFNENLKCRDFQYEIGKTFEEDDANLCSSGFHACENPIDTFMHYLPSNSRYCEVELEDVSDQKRDDSKRCAKKITINKEIGIKGIVDAFVELVSDKDSVAGDKISAVIEDKSATTNTEHLSTVTNTGESSVVANTGHRSMAINTGRLSVSVDTGNRSVAANTGELSVSANTGKQSVVVDTGNRSVAANTGELSESANTGSRSVATNTGNLSAAINEGLASVAINIGHQSTANNIGRESVAVNTGYQSAATVAGKGSIAIATGIKSKVKGAKGCYIVLAEWKPDKDFIWNIVCVKSALVDGERIKADTFYRLKNGEFVESVEVN